ncbi:PspC domain-containing protein [Brevibacillus ruminantium]|uniref:PspC domain-containing protein n=1 Tax=Brevibacillus ruminantium TaxID=2950604 RepID=A0ABY4WJK8_9BACL|nr:PspC domain-containing protein [Brevibacillus ruminantium]USG67267.1 PspC domain-containing protein [Brevibacillus ruminantium]
MMERRLYRSRYDKRLFGVCGGVAHFLGMDATLVRIGLVILTLFTGVPLFIYFIMALIMPKEPVWSPGQDSYGAYDPMYSRSHGDSLDGEIDRLEKRALMQEVQRLRAELAKWKGV